jgi:hypothetical protein
MNNLLRLIIVGVLLAFAVLMLGLGMARDTTDLLAPLHLLLFGIAVVVYLLPTALEHFLFYCRPLSASLNQACALPEVIHGRASVMA